MTIEELLLRSMPYGASFLFVDVFDRVGEDGAEGRYRFPPESSFYEAHFPDAPVTPGAILIETMAQIGLVGLGAYLTGVHRKQEALGFAFTEAQVSFLRPVLPGEEVTVRSKKVYFRLGKLKCTVGMTNEAGDRVSYGTMAGMILKPGPERAVHG
jgi:3-hydroxyacyl-[acyl-carrier-protein] dehydratase